MKESRIVRGVVVYDRKTHETVEIDLDVEIATDLIAYQLAAKAYNNKARKTRALHGLIEVKMRGTKVTPVRETA